MKICATSGGFPTPHFERIFSPSCLLNFIRKRNFPVILKPLLGCASSGITILRNTGELHVYLKDTFFERIDENGKRMDYSGDLIVEVFQEGYQMAHVNGYAKNGDLQIIWPFTYLSTNLSFTHGSAYGNLFLSQGDSLRKELIEATQRLLKILPCPDNLVFHLELFIHPTSGEISLCEIAARRPGGSIGSLIDSLENGRFHEMEFRLSNGLGLLHERRDAEVGGRVVGDLMVPYSKGVLKYFPSIEEFKAQFPDGVVEYRPLAKVGTRYEGFNVNHLNTAARFVINSTIGADSSAEELTSRLRRAHQWFAAICQYEPLEQAIAVDNLKAEDGSRQLETALAGLKDLKLDKVMLSEIAQ